MERRVCPECGRLLSQLDDRYLCDMGCWKLFTYEETLPHPHPEHLCLFIQKVCEMGIYLICLKCNKTIFVDKAELEEKRKRFESGYVDARRLEVEEREKKARTALEFERRQRVQLQEAFEQMLAGIRLTTG